MYLQGWSTDGASNTLSSICPSLMQPLTHLFIHSTVPTYSTVNSKGKAIPAKARIGPECSSRFRFPDFITIGTRRRQCYQPHAPAAFTPSPYTGNIPGNTQRLSWPQVHSAVWCIMSMKNSNDTIGNLTRDLLAQCLNQLRLRVPNSKQYIIIYFVPFAWLFCCFFCHMTSFPTRRPPLLTLPSPGS